MQKYTPELVQITFVNSKEYEYCTNLFNLDQSKVIKPSIMKSNEDKQLRIIIHKKTVKRLLLFCSFHEQ